MRFTWELQKANGRKSSVGCFFLSFCLSFFSSSFFFFFFFLLLLFKACLQIKFLGRRS